MPKKTTEFEQAAPLGWDDPYVSAEAITPADSDLANGRTRAILVTAAGNLGLRFIGDGATDVTVPVNANTLYKFCVSRINATNTTATGIIAFR